jgi:hypothetical protein
MSSIYSANNVLRQLLSRARQQAVRANGGY